jgi:hypothetical protein
MPREPRTVIPPIIFIIDSVPGMKKKPTEPSIPSIGSAVIRLLPFLPARASSGGGSRKISPVGTCGG